MIQTNSTTPVVLTDFDPTLQWVPHCTSEVVGTSPTERYRTPPHSYIPNCLYNYITICTLSIGLYLILGSIVVLSVILGGTIFLFSRKWAWAGTCCKWTGDQGHSPTAGWKDNTELPHLSSNYDLDHKICCYIFTHLFTELLDFISGRVLLYFILHQLAIEYLDLIKSFSNKIKSPSAIDEQDFGSNFFFLTLKGIIKNHNACNI